MGKTKNAIKIVALLIATQACEFVKPGNGYGRNKKDKSSAETISAEDSLKSYISDLVEEYDCDLRVYYSKAGRRIIHCRGFDFYDVDIVSDEILAIKYEENYSGAMDFAEGFMDDMDSMGIPAEMTSREIAYPFMGFPDELVVEEVVDENSRVRVVIDKHSIYTDRNGENSLASHGFVIIEFLDESIAKIIDEMRSNDRGYN